MQFRVTPCRHHRVCAGPTAHVAEWHSVPVRELLMIAIGTPVIAGAAGWLLAGRMPRAIGRQPTG